MGIPSLGGVWSPHPNREMARHETQMNEYSADSLDERKVHFADVAGARTRYYEGGQGRSLALFHGGQYGHLYSLDSWSLNIPAFERDFHVFAVDKLGQGFTANPGRDEDYAYEALFDHSVRFLEDMAAAPYDLVGHSRAGLLVADIALRRPDLVGKLVLVDTNTLAPTSPYIPPGSFYESLPSYAAYHPPAVSGPLTIESVRTEPIAQSYSRASVTEDYIRRMWEIAQLPQVDEARRRMATLNASTWLPSMNRWKQEVLKTVDESGLPVPTLLVWGANDLSAPLPVSGYQLYERIARTTADVEFTVLNHAGHYCFRDQPRKFNRAVRSFLLD